MSKPDQAQSQVIGEVPARVLAGQMDFSAAWERVEEKAGMPGADGVSVRRFAKSAEALLRALQARLAAEEYRSCPLRLAAIEKKSGGRRLLLVPAVVDRVAQTAVAQWLGRRWNSDFDPSSFAYRPGMGVADALRALAELRDRGYRWVLDADIRTFFDSIVHAVLFAKLEQWLGARSAMLRWIQDWVAAAIWDGGQITRLGCGVPQGSPLSPLLANYYLDDFDRRLRTRGIPFIRYADDFLVLARTPFELADSRKLVEEALSDLSLTLSAEKTRTTSFDQCFRFLGAEIQRDSILLPFEKKKSPKQPVYVAPVMSPALLRAFLAGRLPATRPFVWTGEPPVPAKSGSARRPPAKNRFLVQLAGNGAGAALDSLRRRLI